MKMYPKLLLVSMVFLLSLGSTAQVNVWTGTTGNNWNTPSNWSLNQIPTLNTNVLIPVAATGNYPLVTGLNGVADCANLTIEAGASVTVNSDGDGNLRVAGNITNYGTLDVSNGTLTFTGLLPQTITANDITGSTVRNLRVINVSGLTLSTPLNVTGILRVQTGVFNTGNYLTLKSSPQGTAMIDEVTGTITGEMTIERYYPARRAFRFMSSPTSGGTINSNWQESGNTITGFGTHITGADGETNGFDATNTNNPSMFTHNNVTSVWEAVTSTNVALQAGTPYRIFVRGDRTIDLSSNASAPTNTVLRSTGTVATGTVQYTNPIELTPGAFIFLGNPYQAPVDMEEVLAASTNFNPQFYYIWDPTLNARGGYVTIDVENNINNIEGSEANKFLQPNQAFFAQILSLGPAMLRFEEAYKNIILNNNSTPSVYRNAGTATAQIKMSLITEAANGQAADGFIIRFNDEYSNAVDTKDAVKPVNQDESMGIQNSGSTLSFESRAIPVAGEVLPVSITTYRGTQYSFSAAVNGLTGVTAMLEDTYTGTVTELANDNETMVGFTVTDDPESRAENRFNIIFTETAMGTGNYANNSFSVYPNPVTDNKFTIANVPAGKAVLYNALGQEIPCRVQQNGNAMQVEPATQLTAGIYIVKISSGTKTETKKIIIK